MWLRDLTRSTIASVGPRYIGSHGLSVVRFRTDFPSSLRYGVAGARDDTLHTMACANLPRRPGGLAPIKIITLSIEYIVKCVTISNIYTRLSAMKGRQRAEFLFL